MGLSEYKQMVILLVIVAFVGLTGLFLTDNLSGKALACGLKGCGDVYVDSYRAELSLNGTLEEDFLYEIKESGKYRMLFRNWKVPLSTSKLDEPYVEFVSSSPTTGTVSYIKNFQGDIKIISSSNTQYGDEISSLAEYNEAGSYKPDRFEAGKYEISYVFRIHPPLECDPEYCHLNLKLSEEHLPYKHVTLTTPSL